MLEVVNALVKRLLHRTCKWMPPGPVRGLTRVIGWSSTTCWSAVQRDFEEDCSVEMDLTMAGVSGTCGKQDDCWESKSSGTFSVSGLPMRDQLLPRLQKDIFEILVSDLDTLNFQFRTWVKNS